MAQGNERSAQASERGSTRSDKRNSEEPQRPSGRNAPPAQANGESAGSRAGSILGSAAERTGLGDGEVVVDSSQGLTGAQGSEAASASDDAARAASEEPGAREERVRQAAYRRYTERGGAGGNDVDDWLAAEAEIGQAPSSTESGRDPT